MRAPSSFKFISVLVGVSTGALAQVLDNPWAKIKTPTTTRSESLGDYGAGCLRGSKKLRDDGRGYQAVRLQRNRHYGHPIMLSFLTELGLSVDKAKSPLFMVGDIGMPRGGPTLSGHSSHQVGMDVDIWFQRFKRRLTLKERETFGPNVLVDSKTKIVNRTLLGKDQIDLLKEIVKSEKVDRVFVNYAIKKELCRRYSAEDWLQKIRPWRGHDYHFHVRLNCPADSPLCAPTEDPLPPGNSCDASLEWWFGPEAQKIESTPSGPPKMPTLPTECEQVLKEI